MPPSPPGMVWARCAQAEPWQLGSRVPVQQAVTQTPEEILAPFMERLLRGEPFAHVASFHLPNSHEAILCWRPISQVRRLRKEWLRSLLRVTEPVLSPGSNPRPCPFTSLTDSVYHANNPEASVNNLGISPGLCETLMLLLAACPHPLLRSPT